MTAPLTTGELRLLHKALELAAGYANTERDESAILELSARIRRAHKTIPSAPDAHTTVRATLEFGGQGPGRLAVAGNKPG